uniref:Uncharacterized protein n=1 Tax=Eutreptiella gymnastica TaxID=73025 RepID=A0A7S4LE68_9EUGL|mmetsp:Transcript_58026/g.95287  ORF Transcript_58026/g.95287 Transcript_58026/m.95287 type:complete len:104 (+) Transcript_58026:263-574(+)
MVLWNAVKSIDWEGGAEFGCHSVFHISGLKVRTTCPQPQRVGDHNHFPVCTSTLKQAEGAIVQAGVCCPLAPSPQRYSTGYKNAGAQAGCMLPQGTGNEYFVL